MGIFTKIKENFAKRREEKQLQRDMENTHYKCDVWELKELRDTPVEVFDYALQSVGLSIETLYYAFDYPDWLMRGMEQAGLGHISIECFIAYVNMMFLSGKSNSRRFR